jgi:hypothetical protein
LFQYGAEARRVRIDPHRARHASMITQLQLKPRFESVHRLETREVRNEVLMITEV